MPRQRRATRGERRHLVQVNGPTALIPDGEGGWVQGMGPLDPPTWRCRIDPASVRELEYVTSGTAVANASHILEGDFHPGINTQTQIVFGARTFFVNGVINPEERSIDTIAFCEEQVP